MVGATRQAATTFLSYFPEGSWEMPITTFSRAVSVSMHGRCPVWLCLIDWVLPNWFTLSLARLFVVVFYGSVACKTGRLPLTRSRQFFLNTMGRGQESFEESVSLLISSIVLSSFVEHKGWYQGWKQTSFCLLVNLHTSHQTTNSLKSTNSVLII